jgi:hypothetical protein
MEWYIKELLLAILPGVFVILGFIRFNVWVNSKIDKYNEKQNPNNISHHETF